MNSGNGHATQQAPQSNWAKSQSQHRHSDVAAHGTNNTVSKRLMD